MASSATLLPGQPVSSNIPTEAKFPVSLLSLVVGWVGGGKSKLKLNSAQLELELGLSLAIILNCDN
jgi:hypothetical protein